MSGPAGALQEQSFSVETKLIIAPATRAGVRPAWVDPLVIGLLIYVVADTAWMLTGLGGPTMTHYVGLLSDLPAALVSVIVAAATARHVERGPLRLGWTFLAGALGLYLVGLSIGTSSWLRNIDPFPGPADIFYCAFYLAAGARGAVSSSARPRCACRGCSCRSMRTIFVVGFGAFFWFLVIRPAASATRGRPPQAGTEPGLRWRSTACCC